MNLISRSKDLCEQASPDKNLSSITCFMVITVRKKALFWRKLELFHNLSHRFLNKIANKTSKALMNFKICLHQMNNLKMNKQMNKHRINKFKINLLLAKQMKMNKLILVNLKFLLPTRNWLDQLTVQQMKTMRTMKTMKIMKTMKTMKNRCKQRKHNKHSKHKKQRK